MLFFDLAVALIFVFIQRSVAGPDDRPMLSISRTLSELLFPVTFDPPFEKQALADWFVFKPLKLCVQPNVSLLIFGLLLSFLLL